MCDQCGKEYSSQSRLALHFLSHEDPKIKCANCPQLFRTKNALDRHSYLHRDEKFICIICKAERSSPGALHRHMRKLNFVPNVSQPSNFNNQFSESTHNENAKLNLLECKICAKKFKKKNLRRHMLTHSSCKGKIFWIFY